MHGIALMLIAIGLLSGMDAIAKILMQGGMPAIQILALRSVIIVPLLLSVFALKGKLATLKPTRPVWHLGRGLIGFVAPLTFFLGIQLIPLTDAVTVSFSAIFIITILSIVFLGEKVGIHRWASILTGFIGVMVVIGPKGGGELMGYALVLTGSVAYAILFISGRYLSDTESVSSLVFSFNLTVGLISLCLLPFFWQPQPLEQYALLMCLALFAVCGHHLMTLAVSLAEATLIAPFEYTAVLWALTFDLLIWQVVPSMSTAIGAAIVISSGLYIVYRERANEAQTA